jgi:hypothetical protein
MPVAALAVLLLACWPDRAASAAPSDATCFDCEWLELPLDEWNALRNTTVVEVLPWGEAVTLPPVDYRRLGEELCECVLDSREGIPGEHNQHRLQPSGSTQCSATSPGRHSCGS